MVIKFALVLTGNDILNILKKNKPDLQEHFGVKSIGLFGSYAKEQQKPGSDIDIYVELEYNHYQNILGVILYLEKILNHKVDLIYKNEFIRKSFLKSIEKDTQYA